MKRARGAASMLFGIAALSGAGAVASAGAFDTSPSRVETPRTAVAVLSPRRAPEALVRFVADTRLERRVDQFVNGAPADTCVAIDAGERAVLRRNEAKPLIPASTMKLLTARAALARLGEDSTFATHVLARELDAGTVNGDLVLYGQGDPLLATADYAASGKYPMEQFSDFAELVKLTIAAGVQRITGRVVGDDGAFDRERYVPSWKPDYARDGQVGPIGALALNDGYVSFGPRPVAAADPALVAAARFRDALVAAGVVVDGPAASEANGPGPTDLRSIVKLTSPDLAVVVREMLVNSDNNTAELLLKRLTQGAANRKTRLGGLGQLRDVLAEQRLPVEDLTAVDGSGLDRGDRVSCRLLLAALDSPKTDVRPLLSVAGGKGTLKDRFLSSPLRGKLGAKTGSLDGVTGLAGFTDVTTQRGLRFAFLANGPFSEAGGRQLQDRLVAILATYPEAPRPSAIAP